MPCYEFVRVHAMLRQLVLNTHFCIDRPISSNGITCKYPNPSREMMYVDIISSVVAILMNVQGHIFIDRMINSFFVMHLYHLYSSEMYSNILLTVIACSELDTT